MRIHIISLITCVSLAMDTPSQASCWVNYTTNIWELIHEISRSRRSQSLKLSCFFPELICLTFDCQETMQSDIDNPGPCVFISLIPQFFFPENGKKVTISHEFFYWESIDLLTSKSMGLLPCRITQSNRQYSYLKLMLTASWR